MCFGFLCVHWSGPYLRALMHWRVVVCVCGGYCWRCHWHYHFALTLCVYYFEGK